MPARVLFVGFDAAEATLIERWAAEGHLPTFARLAAARAPVRLGNTLETLPGAIWPEISSGRSSGKEGLFYHPQQIRSGEARFHPVRSEDIDPRTFVTVASDAGRRVAAVDIPQTVLTRGLNGLQVTEWGLHDRNYGIASEPLGLIDDLRAHHGDHPIDVCDLHGETEQGYDRLLDACLAGARAKTEMLLGLMARESWDLFACAYGESHCVGHQFWHFWDATFPTHPPDAKPRFRDALLSVYRVLDEGLGRLAEAAGPDAQVLALASHGMGPYIGGPQLLPEVLARLGMGASLRARVRANLPQPLVAALRALIPFSIRRRAHLTVQERLSHPLESPATRAISVSNNRCGGIRLNLRGREPHGSVGPGAEAEALLDEISAELHALELPDGGEHIVRRVVRSREVFGPNHHPNLPDLMVVFRTDIGRLQACRSKRIGTVRAPLHKPHIPRTGDHTIETRLWTAGARLAVPSASVSVPLGERNVLDVAPTILALLGVTPPAWFDGRSLADPSMP